MAHWRGKGTGEKGKGGRLPLFLEGIVTLSEVQGKGNLLMS